MVSGNSLQDTVQCDWELFEIAHGIEGRSFWEKDNIPVNEKHISHVRYYLPRIGSNKLERNLVARISYSTFSTLFHPLHPTRYRIYSFETFSTIYADGRFRHSKTILRNPSEFLT